MAFYVVVVVVAVAIYITVRWAVHREPQTERSVEWTHVDIDGECIRTETTTITTVASRGFPFVETTTKEEVIHWIGRDTHWLLGHDRSH